MPEHQVPEQIQAALQKNKLHVVVFCVLAAEFAIPEMARLRHVYKDELVRLRGATVHALVDVPGVFLAVLFNVLLKFTIFISVGRMQAVVIESVASFHVARRAEGLAGIVFEVLSKLLP